MGYHKLTISQVRRCVEVDGYKLLSGYTGSMEKIQIQCPIGHVFKMRYANFYTGQRCPVCQLEKKRFGVGFIKNYIESVDGYMLLSSRYEKSRDTKLDIRCNKGHDFQMTFDNFKAGRRCPHHPCNALGSLDRTTVSDRVLSYGYKLMGKYENRYSPITLQCSMGHGFETRFIRFYYTPATLCPICFPISSGTSNIEDEMIEHIRRLYTGVIIRNDRTQILSPITGRYLELDCWLPEIMKAIEFNGLYWHSKSNVVRNDEIKKEICASKGISLLVIENKKDFSEIDKFLNI